MFYVVTSSKEKVLTNISFLALILVRLMALKYKSRHKTALEKKNQGIMAVENGGEITAPISISLEFQMRSFSPYVES